MLSKLNSISLYGLQGKSIKVEVDLRGGLPGFSIIGLPDTMVRESKDRVLSAIRNSGYKVPLQRIIVNLAPANLRKQGTIFDLPIALGILISSKQIDVLNMEDVLFAGELSLDGSITQITGALCISLNAKELKFKNLFLPIRNVEETELIDTINIIGVNSLNDTISKLKQPIKIVNNKINKKNFTLTKRLSNCDFSEVKGQLAVKRAIEIAVSGSHNVILIGPPGSGKTMIARRIPTIMPELTINEMLETTMIYSVSNKLNYSLNLVDTRPFRTPHHTASVASIIGGGDIPKPGEITLAHNGVLFLDEFPFFKKNIIQALREPMEDRIITISRSSGTAKYPSDFMFVAAMNPCPCGNLTHPDIDCICSENAIKKYHAKISGPILDRIDIYINVPKINYKDLLRKSNGETSETIRKRVQKTREIQNLRFKNSETKSNASMTRGEIENYCELDIRCKKLITITIEKLKLSGRGMDKILKISRTIADMDNSEKIKEEHLLEAIQYRKPIL